MVSCRPRLAPTVPHALFVASFVASGGSSGVCATALEKRLPVLFDFDIPVIETYRQLMGVIVVVVKRRRAFA